MSTMNEPQVQLIHMSSGIDKKTGLHPINLAAIDCYLGCSPWQFGLFFFPFYFILSQLDPDVLFRSGTYCLLSGTSEQSVYCGQLSLLMAFGHIQAWEQGEPSCANNYQHNQKLNKGQPGSFQLDSSQLLMSRANAVPPSFPSAPRQMIS